MTTPSPLSAPGQSESEAPSTVLLTEIYPSIQGESSHAGRPCVFIRLTGCPLRCSWCDTEYAFTGGDRLPIDEVLRRTSAFGIDLVEVTGGEPLAQEECLELLTRLCDAGHETLLETSGAMDISGVDRRVKRIMDIKCPGSGEADSNRWENLAVLQPTDEIKFVLRDRADYDWAVRVIEERTLERTGAQLLFSPVHGVLPSDELAGWILEDKVPARLQIQLHKILWPGQSQGV